jgi:hypothetical protein
MFGVKQGVWDEEGVPNVVTKEYKYIGYTYILHNIYDKEL